MRSAPARKRLALVLWLCLVCACAATTEPWDATWVGRYGDLPVLQRLEFARARADLEEGRLLEARARLLLLCAEFPDQIDLGVALQDVEEALLLEADAAFARELGLDADVQPAEALRARYEELAKSAPSVATLVLAARVATDELAAIGYLDRALGLIAEQPCAWAHYAYAHVLLRGDEQYRWRDARLALARALADDPGHLAARRLEAWMVGQEGNVSKAILLHERWLQESAGDPRIAASTRVRARVDLARLLVLSGSVEAARAELDSLLGEDEDRARRLSLMVVIEQEGGDIAAAVDAAQRARLADGSTLLPLVQEALLEQYWRKDPDAAIARWKDVELAAGATSDLGGLVQGLRARVELERLSASSVEAAAEGTSASSAPEL